MNILFYGFTSHTAFCETLPSIANGMISYSTNVMGQYNLGTVATYTCNPGYELTGPGDEMRTCVDNGDGSGLSFNGTDPTCERKFLII